MYLMIPGINGSGAEHWQTLWEAHDSGFHRVEQNDWDHPELDAWMNRLNSEIETHPQSWVVAHSLGCLLIVSKKFSGNIRGAFLVAPPNPAGPEFPNVAKSFADFSTSKLAFKSIVVSSQNDPYSSVDFAKRCATTWGSEFVSVGKKGHINSQSGLGFWDEGYQLFQKFIS